MATRRKYNAGDDVYMHTYANEHEKNNDKAAQARDEEFQNRIAMIRAAKMKGGKASLKSKELNEIFRKDKST